MSSNTPFRSWKCPVAAFCFAIFLTVGGGLVYGVNVITSISRDGRIEWTGAGSVGVTAIEESSTLASGSWRPRFYALPSDGAARPPRPEPVAFYRLSTATNPPDPTLVLHLSFDNEFTNGLLLDCSGHANHGIRYATNRWPSITSGPDGSQAGDFHEYYDGYGKYGKSGDYVVIQHSPSLTNLPQATFAAWAWYYTAPSGDYRSNKTCTILDGLYQGAALGWRLGRAYTDNTRFEIMDANKQGVSVLSFPDPTYQTAGNSGGWNHYVVTFDGSVFRGYFNGSCFQAASVAGVTNLVAGGTYIALATWNFGRSPTWYDSDGYPNAGWMNGGIDDVRIYNRALGTNEVLGLYESYAPTSIAFSVGRASAPPVLTK